MHRADYNVIRLAAYTTLFNDFLHSKHDECIAINLLTDVKWTEIPRAFVTTLSRACAAGPVRPLAADFEHVLAQTAVMAFGTTEHARLPSWFLQNWEGFLASCTHKLLIHYARRPATREVMHRAFDALLQVAEGVRKFVGLQTVRSGAHALLAACHHSQVDFLGNESLLVGAPHLTFVEVLAAKILREPECSMDDRYNSLSFFAKSAGWQKLSRACAPWLSHDSELSRLNLAIRRGELHGSADIASLASAFLATSPPRPERRSVHFRTPIKPSRTQRAICKRSTPFVDLVRKLVKT